MEKGQELKELEVLMAKSKLMFKETGKALQGQERQALAEQKAIDDWDQTLSTKKSVYIEAIRSGNEVKKRALEIQIRDMIDARTYAITDEINRLKMEYRKNLDVISSPIASANDKYWAKEK